MTDEEVSARVTQIATGLASLGSGWAFLTRELDERIDTLTEQLINNDNEQTRGRIKALLEIKNLPATLQAEREGLSAALADWAAAF